MNYLLDSNDDSCRVVTVFLVTPLRGVTHLLALRAAGLSGWFNGAKGSSFMQAASVIDRVR